MFWLIVAIIIIFVVVNKRKKAEAEKRYKALETEVLQKLGFPNWSIIPYFDEFVASNKCLNELYKDKSYLHRPLSVF